MVVNTRIVNTEGVVSLVNTIPKRRKYKSLFFFFGPIESCKTISRGGTSKKKHKNVLYGLENIFFTVETFLYVLYAIETFFSG